MTDISTLFLILAVLLFVIGVLLFVRFFPWKKERPLYMKVVFDVSDYQTFDAIMKIISAYDLMDGEYEEGHDTSYITLGVPKDLYESIYTSIRALPNVEVI